MKLNDRPGSLTRALVPVLARNTRAVARGDHGSAEPASAAVSYLPPLPVQPLETGCRFLPMYLRGVCFLDEILTECSCAGAAPSSLQQCMERLVWSGMKVALLQTTPSQDAWPLNAGLPDAVQVIGCMEAEGRLQARTSAAEVSVCSSNLEEGEAGAVGGLLCGELGAEAGGDDVGQGSVASMCGAIHRWAQSSGMHAHQVLLLHGGTGATRAGGTGDLASALARDLGCQVLGLLSGASTASTQQQSGPGPVQPGHDAVAGAALGQEPAARAYVSLAGLPLRIAHYQAVLSSTCTAGSRAACAGSTVGDGSSSGASTDNARVLVVGYLMKLSREKDLTGTGLLSLLPQDGVCFAPLDPAVPLAQQLPLDAVLHKASDELQYDDVQRSTPQLSARMQALRRQLEALPELCVVDPLDRFQKVINRLDISRLTTDLCLPGGLDVCAPAYFVVESCGVSEEVQATAAASGVSPPYIVKALVACGLPDSHHMALALNSEGLVWALQHVPLPAIVQQFTNHGGRVYKVYVAGDKVFHTVRPSIPDLDVDCLLAASPDSAASGALMFDSLKSLPTQLPSSFQPRTQSLASLRPLSSQPHAPAPAPACSTGTAAAAGDGAELDVSVRDAVAEVLRQRFGLSLFGFDLIVERRTPCLSSSGSGGADSASTQAQQPAPATSPSPSPSDSRYLIIDVNYFPSYREVQGMPAAFRAAVKQAVEKHQRSFAGPHGVPAVCSAGGSSSCA